MSARTTTLLDTARAGRGMAWMIAIMLFLTVLATAAGIGTARAASAMGVRLAGRVTVELASADPARREASGARLAAAAQAVPGVSDVVLVSRGELVKLLGPWLADDAADAELPVPILIDLTVSDDAALARLRAALARVAPAARLDLHDAALAPVRNLLGSLVLVAGALVALMVAATAIVVVLAARAGLETHRQTIEVMHMLGATDVQVARLFQRRLARDAAFGAIAGGAVGLCVVLALSRQMAGLGSELLGAVALGQGGWIALIAMPLAFIVLAALVARRAVTRALGRVL